MVTAKITVMSNRINSNSSHPNIITKIIQGIKTLSRIIAKKGNTWNKIRICPKANKGAGLEVETLMDNSHNTLVVISQHNTSNIIKILLRRLQKWGWIVSNSLSVQT